MLVCSDGGAAPGRRPAALDCAPVYANRLPARLLAGSLLVFTPIASACASPDLGPPSSTTLALEVAEPTPTPTPDLELPPSNQPTPTPEPGVTPTPTPTPEPDFEPGLTDNTMTVAVIADITTGDVDSPPALAAWQAIEAWAAAVNDAGGLAGRRVRVRFIDTGLFSHDDAIREACEGEVFALVGSQALFDDEGLELLLDPDCSLLDMPATANTPRRRESPVTFLSNPFPNDLRLGGPAGFYAETFPDAVTSVATLFLDLPTTIINGEQQIEANTAEGLTYVYTPTVAFDDDYATHATTIAETDVQAVTWSADGERFIDLLSALEEEEVELGLYDCAGNCYRADWVAEAGALGEGVFTSLTTVPFEEADANFELTRYLFWLGRTDPEAVPDTVGVRAWAAGLLFEEAVNRAVRAGTDDYDPSLLTRASVLDAADTIDAWDARGLHGVSNPAEGLPSPCFVVMQLSQGAWVRVHPFGRGAFDCDADNLVQLIDTARLGLDEPITTDATPTPAPDVPTPTPDGG